MKVEKMQVHTKNKADFFLLLKCGGLPCKGGRRQCTGSQSVMGGGAGEDFKGQEQVQEERGEGDNLQVQERGEGDNLQVQEKGEGVDLQVQERGEGGREATSTEEKRGVAGEKGGGEEVVQENRDKASEEKGTMDQGSERAAVAYKEGYTDTVGRLLLATRPLSVGEVVVEDFALLAAPDGAPVCLGCLAGLTQSTPVNCPNCGWPLCRF